MEATDKKPTTLAAEILSRTHYGMHIYFHILRIYYPNEVVLKLSKRSCGVCRNPFNEGKNTLRVFIHKENVLGDARDKEITMHEDTDNAIAPGDAFAFAELHYKQSGDELCETLIREMKLHIGDKFSFYQATETKVHSKKETPCEEQKGVQFSFFRAPIRNTKPHKAISLLDVYKYIVGDFAKATTEQYRAMLINPECTTVQRKAYKLQNFAYATFSGTFTERNDKALIKHSGLLCVDFDHLQDLEELFQKLLKDEYFDTQLLFRSPSADGLKWIIPIDTTQTTHGNFFSAVANYIKQTYGVEVDKSGRDVSRACFLAHDPQAFINPILSTTEPQLATAQIIQQ